MRERLEAIRSNPNLVKMARIDVLSRSLSDHRITLQFDRLMDEKDDASRQARFGEIVGTIVELQRRRKS